MHMALPLPTSLSPSKVSTFKDCALAFRFSAIDKLPEPPSMPAVKGTTVHKALELLFADDASERTPARAAECLDLALELIRADEEYEGLQLSDADADAFAADAVVIPLQCETLSHRGVGQLLETIADVRAYAKPDLAVLGAIPTMFDGRSRHPREIAADVAARYGLRVFEPAVPRSIRFAEAPASGASILDHAPKSRGAEAYRELARQITEALEP